MKKILIGASMLATVIAIGFAVSVYAWQPPTQNAPGGNVDAPLNTGPAMQIKSGPLGTTDTLLGFFGALAKLKQVRVGNGCPIFCYSYAATDIFDAMYRVPTFGNPTGLGGIAVLGNGQVRIRDGSNPSIPPVPGQVLTVADASGTVKWAPPAAVLPPGQNNHTLRYNGTTQLWEDSGLIQNDTSKASIIRPAASTDTENLVVDASAGTGAGGRAALTANVSADNVTAGEYATLKTNAKGFSLWDLTGTNKTDLSAHSGFFSQIVDGPLGQFTQSVASPTAQFGHCHQTFLPLLSCYGPAGNVFSATAGSTISSSNFNIFPTTSPKGIYVDNSGSFIIHDWTTLTPPAGLAGKVLTADASGAATWKPSSLPTGGNVGDVLTTTSGGTAWQPGLPVGTVNHTLRYNGTKWVDAGNLQNDTTRVAVNTEFNSGQFTGSSLTQGLKVKSDGTISAGIFNNQNVLTNGFGSAPTQGVFQVGTFGLGVLGRGFQVVQPPAGPSGIGIAGSKGVPLGADVSGLQGTDGQNALFLNAHSMGGTAPSVSIVTNSKNLTLWNGADNKFTNLTAGNATFQGVGKIIKQPSNGYDAGLTIDLSQASTLSDSIGRDGIAVNVNDANKTALQPAYLSTNAQGFGLWSGLKNSFGDFRAGVGTFGDATDQVSLRSVGMVQIQGGNPSQGTVLASNDAQGNAEWGNLTTTGGSIMTIAVQKNCHINSGGGWGGPTQEASGTCTGSNGDDVATAICPADYPTVTGGGGDCEVTRTGNAGTISEPTAGNTSNPVASGSVPGGWKVHCGIRGNESFGTVHGDAHAYVICAKVIPPTVSVTTSGGKQWHWAASGQAPSNRAATCPSAYNGYNGHTFLNTQVAYVKQTWEGHWGGNDLHKTAGPGANTAPGHDPGTLSDADILSAGATGSCAVWTSDYNNNNPGQGHGSGNSSIPSDPTSVWQGLVQNAPAFTSPNTDPTFGHADVWYTYLKY